MDELTRTLLALERRGWDALCNSTGDRFYGDIMTADAVMVLANGAVMDRDSVVAALREAPPWAGYVITDERVIRIGADSAVSLLELGAASWLTSPSVADVSVKCDISPPFISVLSTDVP